MGLIISGVKIGPVRTTNEEEKMDTFVYKCFERSLLPEEIVTVDCEYENEEILAEGLELSYSGYSYFRESLSIAALGITHDEVCDIADNLRKDEEYPSAIYHLLYFADNEGYIGPKAVKELDNYFKVGNDERIRKKLPHYNNINFRKVFDKLVNCIKETAKEDGYLKFW